MRTCCALVVVAALAAGCGGDPHGSLTLRATSGLADAPVTLTVHASERATLHASWTAYGGHVWRSTVPLRAGTTTLRGVDGMRFEWGMRPVGPAYKHPFFLPPFGRRAQVALSVVAGGRTLGRATLSRRLLTPSVRMRHLTVRHDGMEGLLYTPAVHGRRPAAVVFGGSEGGNGMYDTAALLAAHGYPTMGDSRGGELALLLASTFPRLIHGAIGLVPSAYVYPSLAANLPAWTLRGKPIWARPIQVERISGPVLTAGAGDDAVWGSENSVKVIERRLRAHRFRFRHDGLVYAHAGHIIGAAVPYLPAPTDQGAFGGTARADQAAKADLWPKILRYFARL